MLSLCLQADNSNIGRGIIESVANIACKYFEVQMLTLCSQRNRQACKPYVDWCARAVRTGAVQSGYLLNSPVSALNAQQQEAFVASMESRTMSMYGSSQACLSFRSNASRTLVSMAIALQSVYVPVRAR